VRLEGVTRNKWVVGIDEAGRGSLVGELIVAGYALSLDKISLLETLGVTDSKMLTPSSRKRLYNSLITLSNIFVAVPVSPEEIDQENLNVLTEKAIIKIIKIIVKRVGDIKNLAAIYIDKFGKPRFLPKILREMGYEGFLVIEEKADLKYKIVGAASIIAKYIRDKRIKTISKIYGLKGSGYPSDPHTVEWVKNVIRSGRYLPIIRYSWSTLKDLGYGRKKSGSKSLLDFLR
jgi:ribonuclease HII